MPAPPLSNTFEGGTDTTTITTGNSGGASGDAFQTVAGACTFSATQEAHGALSMQAATGAGGVATRVTWTGLGSITGAVYFRWYMWFPILQVAGNMFVLRVTNNAAGQSCALNQNATTGFFRFFNAANSGIAASLGTVAPTTSTWVRLEARVVSSTTVGEVAWRLYNSPESTTITDSGSATGQVLAANSDTVEFGLANNTPASQNYYYDDLAVSTVDWIGPAVAPEGTITPHFNAIPFIGGL